MIDARREHAPEFGIPERIARWEEFGGTWSVTHAAAGRAVIELRRCDGGEVVETIDSTDPDVVRWAAAAAGPRLSGRAADG